MIGTRGLELIKKFEGFAVLPYLCPAGKPTIGYGHVIRAGENWSKGINLKQAEDLLLKDIDYAEKTVVDLLDDVPLSGSQCDALTSFIFNVGVNAFNSSQMKKYLLVKDFIAAAGEFPRWCKVVGLGSKGLFNRRIEEMKLFLS